MFLCDGKVAADFAWSPIVESRFGRHLCDAHCLSTHALDVRLAVPQHASLIFVTSASIALVWHVACLLRAHIVLPCLHVLPPNRLLPRDHSQPSLTRRGLAVLGHRCWIRKAICAHSYRLFEPSHRSRWRLRRLSRQHDSTRGLKLSFRASFVLERWAVSLWASLRTSRPLTRHRSTSRQQARCWNCS